GPHLQVVFPDYPGKRVSKCSQILIQSSIGIPIAVSECEVLVIKTDGWMTECCKFPAAGYGAISVDIRRIKSYRRKETVKSCIAMPIQVFAVKSATGFIDDVRVECTIVRNRNRIVPAFILLEAHTGVTADHRLVRDSCAGCGVHHVHPIFITEIVIDAQSAGIGHAIARQNRVKSDGTTAAVDRNARANLREVVIDEGLSCRVQQSRRDLDKTSGTGLRIGGVITRENGVRGNFFWC